MATKDSGNVVQLQEHEAFTRRFSPAGAARLLHDCRDKALERIAKALARAMDNVDDALFALADKASTNTLQAHYFDAMREIRIKRQEIETSFKDNFGEASDSLIANTKPTAARNTTANITEIGLSLVEHDDLEESLAINTLADKLEALCHGELFALDKRVGFLLDQKELATEANPIGPKTICNAFKSACVNIESGVDIKIIVFKLFDRYLCENIQFIYHEINDYLASNAVLPRIATQIKNGQAQTGNGYYPGGNMTNSPNGAEPDFLSAFTQLMAVNRPQPGNGMCLGQVIEGGMPALLQDLTLLQQGRWDALGTQAAAIDPRALANGTTNVVRIIKDNTSSNGAGNGDDMVIEVVALLFDYIFDNGNIPDRAKALIGRLQIPTLKVAILDKTFFSKRHHPARRLLNTLAHATVGLHDERAEESELYKELEACIQKVQVEFDTDIAVFENVLSDLEAYLEKHHNHLEENIEEAKKVIQGRERLKIAESLAEAGIERKLEGKPFPEFIKTFAMDKWKNLLIVTYLKEGQESDTWKSRLEMLDLLIWSALPKSNLKDKKKLVDMLPTLIKGIEAGMKLLSMEEAEQNTFLEKLAACHARAVNGDTYTADKPAFNPMGLEVSYLPTEGQTGITAVTSAPRTKPAASKQVGSMLVEEISMLGQGSEGNQDDSQADQTERLLVNIDIFGEAATDEQVATDDQQEQDVTEDDLSEVVKSLVPGIWFEFHDEATGKVMERLSWISEVLGSYLFTDHDGLKTRELSAQQLEDSLRSGHAQLADDLSFLVDRSFNSLLDELQKKVTA